MEIRTIEHTGDVGLEIRAVTVSRLFEAAMRGLVGILFRKPPPSATDSVVLSLSGDDLEELLVRSINELNYLVMAVGTIPIECEIEIVEFDDSWKLAGTVGTVPFDEEAFEFQGEVKSATYHNLIVQQTKTGWLGRVILDV